MLKKEKIDRINHLAKKSKQEGLTEAKKKNKQFFVKNISRISGSSSRDI